MGIDLMDLFLRTLLLTVKNLQIHLDQRVFLWWRYQCLKAKAIVAEVASNLEAVQKENEEKEKGMAKLKEENKRLKQLLRASRPLLKQLAALLDGMT